MSASEPPVDGGAGERGAAEPVVRRARGISLVWLVPLVALALGGWLVWRTLEARGPAVTVTFPTAAGLEAGRTEVRLRDVVVGTVDELTLSRDLETVVTRIAMRPGAERYLTTGTRFWIVQPQIGLEGVTGLSTLLSGAYIAVEPGAGEPARRFEGLDRRPPIPRSAPGKRFVLQTERLGALRVGSPVFLKELPAGEVTGFAVAERPELGDGAMFCDRAAPAAETTAAAAPDPGFLVEIYVREPYAGLVYTDSHFVNASGVAMDVEGRQLRVQIQSLSALIAGGVAFGQVRGPDDARTPAPDCRRFPLFADLGAARSANLATRRTPVLLYFEGAVGGLEVGAPVTFRGLDIGEVTEVDLTVDVDDAGTFTIPVTVELFEDAIGFSDQARAGMDDRAFAEWLIASGLRARLAVANIVTGALAVQFEVDPDAAPAELRYVDGVPVLPTRPSSLDELTASVETILTKLAALPLDELSGRAASLLASAEAVVGSPAIPAAIDDARATAAALRALAESLDGAVGPIARETRGTLARADEAMGALAEAAGDAGRLTFSTEQLMGELRAAARALRTFAEFLERNPEALIRGRQGRR